MVHIYNVILLIHKKEWNNAIWCNMGESRNYIKWNKSKRNITWYHFYVESKIMIQMNLFTKQKQTHRHRNKLRVTKGDSGGGERDQLGVWD